MWRGSAPRVSQTTRGAPPDSIPPSVCARMHLAPGIHASATESLPRIKRSRPHTFPLSAYVTIGEVSIGSALGFHVPSPTIRQMMTVSSSPPGIPSPARLEGWLNDTVGGEPSELVDIQLIAGGRSNLTYRLTVAGAGRSRLLVLRRPPLGHVLPTAHDMGREYRVLSGLSGTQVPVARPVAFCDDTE